MIPLFKCKVNYKNYVVSLIVMFILIFYSQLSFAKKSSNENLKAIFGPIPDIVDEIDGLDTYSQDAEWVASKIYEQVPQIVHKSYNSATNQDEWYIRFDKDTLFNHLFFVLMELYPNNVACDTESLIYSYRLLDMPLSILDLHNFLKIRSTIKTAANPYGFIDTKHPYFQAQDKLIKKIGPIISNDKNLKLDQILSVNQQALIQVDGHMGVIKRLDNNQYSASAWNPVVGMIDQKMKYSEDMKFPNPDWQTWGDLKIETYTPISNPIYSSCQITPFYNGLPPSSIEHIHPTDSYRPAAPSISPWIDSVSTSSMGISSTNSHQHQESTSNNHSPTIEKAKLTYTGKQFQLSNQVYFVHWVIGVFSPMIVRFFKYCFNSKQLLPDDPGISKAKEIFLKIKQQMGHLNYRIDYTTWTSYKEKRKAISDFIDIEDQLNNLNVKKSDFQSKKRRLQIMKILLNIQCVLNKYNLNTSV